ncbi:MAG: class II fructose-bisphosphate aldolase [Candidatus Brennerbacteria bacterium]|nr:class II fructose-bisphosphate aldolase [Candidatus Brennerbacteria bacterium]
MNLLEVVKKAEKDKVAVGHFNISNLEMLKAISHVARKLDVPVIIGVSEGEREYLGIHHVRDLVASYNKEHAKGRHTMFLNADHTYSLDKVREAAEEGFDSIIFDGAKLPFEENIAQTKEAVKIVKSINPEIFVEGELGYIGGGSVVRREIPKGAAIRPEDLTKPEEAARFVEETGVDMLAPAVGNIHGMYANAPDPALDIVRIRTIKGAVKIPLVLHGASGNTDQDLRAAIDAGISVIHISTELRVAWRKGLEEALKVNPNEVAPYKLMPEDLARMEEVIEKKLRLFSNS